MKPEVADRPFRRAGWTFELKYDGFRALATAGRGPARILYRSGHDATRLFPELAAALAGLGDLLGEEPAILDGEVVILDPSGRPAFQRLQRRALRTRAADAAFSAFAARDSPATFFAFDLLALEGYDLRPLPLRRRKDLLKRLLSLPGVEEGPIRYLEDLPERGDELYAAVAGLGLEGIVAKRESSPYRGGYSPDWLKVRVDRVAELAIVGFRPTPGTRAGLRKLDLAFFEGGAFHYAGSVGTGFDREEEAELRARLDPLRRPDAPLAGGAPPKKGIVWVEPREVCEVRYKEWTEAGKLRHPVFLRLRVDKAPEECPRPGAAPVDPAGPTGVRSPPRGEPRFSNLDKVFWPGEGFTKGDLLDYYRAAAPWMLPYLRDRPLVLDRYPDGIEGKSFFQKNAPEVAAGRVRAVPIRSEGSRREIDFLLCDDLEGLLFLVNLGTIPFHLWSSRVAALERPDWCILDLDPKTAPFEHVVWIAREIHGLCEGIGLPSFAKTSGGGGLHVLLPLGGRLDHGGARSLAELLAGLVVARLPEFATTARAIAARRGRVYVDALQNGRGKLLAAPYSARPLPGAPVSTPLLWSEVGEGLDPRDFTIATVPGRFEALGEDPLLPVLTLRPDLHACLARLSERVG
jgi:bifunctional non-homologous end joining protein LigD